MILKDRDRNPTRHPGCIFDSGRLAQLPISRQEVPGATIKLPYRTPSTACRQQLSRWRQFLGLQARVTPLTSGGLS